jgi:hypothetical protein
VSKLAFALAILLGITSGAPVSADEPSDRAKEEAGTRFDRGIKLYDAQDFAAALAEFEAAYRLVPRYQVLFNIGVTQKRLFRYNDAVRSLKRYLELGGEKVPQDRRDAVDRELQEIRALVAEVAVKVEGLPASVEVDGRTLGETPLAGPLLLAGGHHVVRASREGYETAVQELDVVSGEHVDIQLAPKLKQKVATTARLSVTTRPPGAELSVDGKLVGKEPWSGTLQPGGHELRASLKGFHVAKQEAVVIAGQDRAVLMELTPVPPPPPWYKRWYTWTVVSLLVAGGVGAGVGGYFATHPPQYFQQIIPPP